MKTEKFTNLVMRIRAFLVSLNFSLNIATVVLVALFFTPLSAFATDMLTDGELDDISAMGDFTLNVGETAGGLPTVSFGFQTGGTSGNGQIIIQPSATPTGGITAGNVNFNGPIHVENMIFNMNICVQCQATTLTQGNVGAPVTIKVVP